MLFQFAKLREISLKRSTTEAFELLFWLEVGDELTDLTGQSNDASSNIQLQESSSFIPEYVSLEVVS